MKKSHPQIITGARVKIIEYCAFLYNLRLAVLEYKSFRMALEVMKKLIKVKMEIVGKQKVYKMVKVNGRYHWNMHLPGFPSKSLAANVLGEMNRIHPVKSKNNRLIVLFFGITKKCPLQCLHCYEWGELNHKETLSLLDLKEIVRKFQDIGVGHIHLGGGEPMARFDDLVELVKYINNVSDIWLSTSGFNLTLEKAKILKEAGLNGVAISLDHFIPELHNAFRGSEKAYYWALSATANCQEAGLITCWSVCVTREFLNKDNLFQYVLFAKEKKVTYIQLFEPMPVGRYTGKDVELDATQKKILEDFYYELNNSPKYKDFPLVVYFGPRQRRIGCLGSGNKYAYVDTNGNIQSCPFCRNNSNLKLKEHQLEVMLDKLKTEDCYFPN